MTMTDPYRQLGGATGVRSLVDRFYRLMDTLPETRNLRAMHPEDLSQAREVLFLCGWLGGPGPDSRCCGKLQLRTHHLPFGVDGGEREQWLLYMERALDELRIDTPLRPLIAEAFQRVADHLQRQYMCHALGEIEPHQPCCRHGGRDETQK